MRHILYDLEEYGIDHVVEKWDAELLADPVIRIVLEQYIVASTCLKLLIAERASKET